MDKKSTTLIMVLFESFKHICQTLISLERSYDAITNKMKSYYLFENEHVHVT